jgi:acyl carrier protein
VNILERVQPIFQDVLDDPSLRVERASSAESVEGWDSLAHINLIASIEKEFGIQFALGELSELKNVGEMIDLMERKLIRK